MLQLDARPGRRPAVGHGDQHRRGHVLPRGPDAVRRDRVGEHRAGGGRVEGERRPAQTPGAPARSGEAQHPAPDAHPRPRLAGPVRPGRERVAGPGCTAGDGRSPEVHDARVGDHRPPAAVPRGRRLARLRSTGRAGHVDRARRVRHVDRLHDRPRPGARPGAGPRQGCGQRVAGGGGRARTPHERLLHQLQAFEVVGAVPAVSSGLVPGRADAVAPVPGAQRGRCDAQPPGRGRHRERELGRGRDLR